MSSKFDFVLVVSKATSLASSSCTSDEDAGTGPTLFCKLCRSSRLPGRETAPARLHKQGYFLARENPYGPHVRYWHLADIDADFRAYPLVGVKRTSNGPARRVRL